MSNMLRHKTIQTMHKQNHWKSTHHTSPQLTPSWSGVSRFPVGIQLWFFYKLGCLFYKLKCLSYKLVCNIMWIDIRNQSEWLIGDRLAAIQETVRESRWRSPGGDPRSSQSGPLRIAWRRSKRQPGNAPPASRGRQSQTVRPLRLFETATEACHFDRFLCNFNRFPCKFASIFIEVCWKYQHSRPTDL